MTARRTALVLTVIAGCSSTGSERLERHTCVVYEGVSRTIPAGGVPATIEVPASWQRTDHDDGSCNFRRAGEPGIVGLSLELCIEVEPCDAKLSSANAQATKDISILDQIMRSTETRRADPQTHRVVKCTVAVQGTQITDRLEAQRQRLVKLCDGFAIAR